MGRRRKFRTVKVGELVDQVKVLEQQRTHMSNMLPALGVVDGSAIGSGIGGLLVIPVGRKGLVVGAHCVGVGDGEIGVVRKRAAARRVARRGQEGLSRKEGISLVLRSKSQLKLRRDQGNTTDERQSGWGGRVGSIYPGSSPACLLRRAPYSNLPIWHSKRLVSRRGEAGRRAVGSKPISNGILYKLNDHRRLLVLGSCAAAKEPGYTLTGYECSNQEGLHRYWLLV